MSHKLAKTPMELTTMEVLKNSVILMGIGPGVTSDMPDDFKRAIGPTIFKTIGTGIIFGYRDYFCVLSCRHVIEPELQHDEFKAIIRYKNSQGVTTGNILGLDKRSIRYHPMDTNSQSHDIGIFIIEKRQMPFLPFKYMEIAPNQYFPPKVEPMNLFIWGYPTNRTTREDVLNVSRPLPLAEISGRLVDAPHLGGKANNFSKSHFLQHIAEINDSSDLTGASGGLVLAKVNHTLYPLGMVTTNGSGRIRNNLTNTEQSLNFVGFVSLPTVLEIFG